MINDKRKVFYEVDPRYFKDGTGEGKGDLKGLFNNMEYIANLGVDVLIVQNILSSLTNEETQNFTGISKELGEVNMLKSIISIAKISKIDIVIELPIATIKENHTWFKSAEAQNNSDFTEIIKLYSKRKVSEDDKNFKYSNKAKGYFSVDENTQEIPLNWKSEQVLNQFKEVIKYWRDLGVAGFVFKEFEYLTDDRREEFMNASTLKELRKLYRAVKEVDDRLYSIGKSVTLNPSEVKKYTKGGKKVFDYFISENISLIGASKKYGTDAIGKFRTRELASAIKTYAKSDAHILGFGSELTGRVNSRWGNHGEYWAESAKSIALILMMNPSSPLIFFGDEIGTLNIGLTHLDDFMDETLDERKKIAMAKGIKEERFMDAQVLQNPINSKSSMAWTDEEHAGFTWAEKIARPVPYTYREINVKKQYSDEESVLGFYKKIAKYIKTGKNGEIIANGKFSISSLIPGLFRIVSSLGDKEIVTYVNLTDKSKKIRKFKEGKVVFSTYSYKKYKELPTMLGAYESIVVTKDTDEAIRNTQLIELAKLKEIETKQREKDAKILESKKAEEEKAQEEISKLEKERFERIQKITNEDEKINEELKTKQFESKIIKEDEIKKQKEEEAKIKEELRIKEKEAKEAEKTRLFEIKQEAKEEKLKLKEEIKASKEENKSLEIEKVEQESPEEVNKEEVISANIDNFKENDENEKQKEADIKLKEIERTQQFELRNKEKEERQALKQKEFEARQKEREEAKKLREIEKTKQFELRNKEKEERQALKQKEFEARQKEREEAKKLREIEKTKQFELKQEAKEQKLIDREKAKEEAEKQAEEARKEKEKALIAAEEAKKEVDEARQRAEIEATKTKEIELHAAEMKEKKAEENATKMIEEETKANETLTNEENKVSEEKENQRKEAEEKQRVAEIQKELERQEAEEEKAKARQEAKESLEKAKANREIEKLAEKTNAIGEKDRLKQEKAKAKEKAKLEKEMQKKLAIELKQAKKQEKMKTIQAQKLAKAQKSTEENNTVLETEFTEEDMTSLLEEDLAGTTQIDIDDVDSFIGLNKKKK